MIEAWVDTRLAAAGRHRTGPVGPFRERPWGTVWRIETDGGVTWLKRPGAPMAFELPLQALLAAHDPEAVLVPLAVDTEAGLMLLPDGGPTLRDRHGEDPDALHRALAMALARYARLQRRLVGEAATREPGAADRPGTAALLAAGVADMTPAAMPERLAAVAALPGADAPEVVAALRRAEAACAALADAPGGASIDHNDLHGANVLDGPRFFDWGDAVLAHPFACLLVPVGTAAWSLGCADDDPRVTPLRDAYLAEWSDVASHDELVRTAELACTVAKVARVLTWKRATELGAGAWDEARPGLLETLRAPSPYAVA